MKRVVALLLAFAGAALAQEPEQCRIAAANAVTVTHAGKSYRLASEACRAQFLSDPERYAQLYDALEELEAEGTPVTAPASASLVPS